MAGTVVAHQPVALTIDPLDHIYVLDRGERKVFMYSPDGALITSVGPSLGAGIELRDPRDIGVDGSSRKGCSMGSGSSRRSAIASRWRSSKTCGH